jgi:membrane-associated phospholipid phosphatase
MKNLAALLIFLSLSFQGICQNVDINILKNINLNRNEKLDPSLRFISNSVNPVSIGAPIVILAVGLIEKDHDLTHRGLLIGETILVSTLITKGLKYSVNRQRPFDTYPFIVQVIPVDSPSFPSGHTSAAFATATSLSLAFPKWYVIAPTFVWASAVGYSRMALGVHYPSDVLVGALVGSGSAYLTYFVNKKIFHKKASKGKMAP